MERTISASPSRRRSATQRGLSRSRTVSSKRGSSSETPFSTGLVYVKNAGETNASCSGIRLCASTAFIRSSKPFLLRAAVPTTGTPRFFESWSKSMLICFFFASSIRLTQTTTRRVISSVWSTRLRLRSRQVASHTTTTASGSPKQMKSRATSSSAECAMREYVPGISTRV